MPKSKAQGNISSIADGTLLPFMFDNIPVRGKILQLNDLSAHIASLENDNFPDGDSRALVARSLGEMLAAATVLAFDLKSGANVTLQVHSGSPLSLMVARCNHAGNLRAFADTAGDISGLTFPDLAKNNGALILTVDHGVESHQYQSVVELDKTSISSSMEAYFTKSAQNATYFKVMTEKTGKRTACGALMLQAIPANEHNTDLSAEDRADAWKRLGLILGTLEPDELIPGRYNPRDILTRLFAEDVVRVFPTQELRFIVPNPRERMLKALKSVGVANCRELLKEGPIHMTCEFSGKEETFSEKDLAELFGEDWGI